MEAGGPLEAFCARLSVLAGTGELGPTWGLSEDLPVF